MTWRIKVLETFLRGSGSYWHDGITQLIQMYWLHIFDSPLNPTHCTYTPKKILRAGWTCAFILIIPNSDPNHLNIRSEVDAQQTRQCFSKLLMFNFGHPIQISSLRFLFLADRMALCGLLLLWPICFNVWHVFHSQRCSSAYLSCKKGYLYVHYWPRALGDSYVGKKMPHSVKLLFFPVFMLNVSGHIDHVAVKRLAD